MFTMNKPLSGDDLMGIADKLDDAGLADGADVYSRPLLCGQLSGQHSGKGRLRLDHMDGSG